MAHHRYDPVRIRRRLALTRYAAVTTERRRAVRGGYEISRYMADTFNQQGDGALLRQHHPVLTSL